MQYQSHSADRPIIPMERINYSSVESIATLLSIGSIVPIKTKRGIAFAKPFTYSPQKKGVLLSYGDGTTAYGFGMHSDPITALTMAYQSAINSNPGVRYGKLELSIEDPQGNFLNF